MLGAGLFQLSGIARALQLGLEVVTVDNVPTNPGHRLAHRAVDLSTTDVAGVVRLASELSVDGIVTFSSDVAVEAVAAVREELGLPGPTLRSVRLLSHKARFRRLQYDHGITHPAFTVVPPDVALEGVGLADLPDAVVVKPADSSGSRGVTILREANPDAVYRAIGRARERSRSGEVVVEGLLRGTEVGGDAFLRAGRLECLFITEKRLNGVWVDGHCYPNPSVTDRQTRVIALEIERCCQAAGLDDGPINFDVMVDGMKAVVIEMSPRTGGNGIPRVIDAVEGVDLEERSILHGLRAAPSSRRTSGLDRSGSTRAVSRVLTSAIGGVVAEVADPNTLLSSERRLQEVWLAARPGDVLSVRDGRPQPFALVIFRLDRAEDEPTRWEFEDLVRLRSEPNVHE